MKLFEVPPTTRYIDHDFFQNFGFPTGWPNIHPFQGRGWHLLTSSRLAAFARAHEYVRNDLKGRGLRNVLVRLPWDSPSINAVVRYKALGDETSYRSRGRLWADDVSAAYDVKYVLSEDALTALTTVKTFEDWFGACVLEGVLPVFERLLPRSKHKLYSFDIYLLPLYEVPFVSVLEDPGGPYAETL